MGVATAEAEVLPHVALPGQYYLKKNILDTASQLQSARSPIGMACHILHWRLEPLLKHYNMDPEQVEQMWRLSEESSCCSFCYGLGTLSRNYHTCTVHAHAQSDTTPYVRAQRAPESAQEKPQEVHQQ